MNDNSRTNSISRPVEGLDRAEVLIDRDGDIHLNTAGASGTVYINGVAYDPSGGGGGGNLFSPFSAFPATAGNTFPNVHVGGGANSKQEQGLGVAASIAADSTWRLRFMLPPTIPTGTAKLRLIALANATSGVAKITVQDEVVVAEESPSGETLTSETQATITWAAGDNDEYKETKVTLTPIMIANGILVADLVFNTTGWTLAQVSTWQAFLIWE